MRRAAVIVLSMALAVAFVVTTGAADESEKPTYRIVFDNASGLVEGADFRVGGVAVGSIEKFDIARQARAIVDVSVADTSFGGLRSDASCKIAQQSLIGEYYIECEPGRSGRVLPSGTTIGVEQTVSPIAADLVQNVMRRPARERLSIILSELGAGFAARGEDVNDTIRRAVPALQETRRVLKILGDNRRTLRALAADSGRVLKVLGSRRRDVSRFVAEAGDTAATTAERRDALQETFRRFPGFLSELEPTMADLGTAAREMAPALADLRAAAPSLTSLLRTLPRFTRASEPALTSLGEASLQGRSAVKEARSTVELLRALGERTAEPANNLELVLSDLDDRGRAVDKDPDSPGGQGYTGLEALLQYPFDQSLAINIFDTRGYILKLTALINECDSYTTAEEAKADMERYKRCGQGLGPNQPGITTPDPSPPPSPNDSGRRRRSATERTEPATAPQQREESKAPDERPAAPAPPKLPDVPGLPDIPDLPELLDRLPDILGGLGTQQRPSADPAPDLLDFLLGP